MALNGTIESFGISEIFQLIEHQGKTGTLQIHTGQGLARIRFLEGRLVEAWPDKRSPAELIGSRLLRAGLVSQGQLGNALDQQRQNLRRLGDILTKMGALRMPEFQEVLEVQHRETVYRLLRLKRGRFEFIPEAVKVEEGVSLSLQVGGVLMEGFRQMDEWPDLLEKIPSERTVYVRVDGAAPPENLAELEAKVLGLVDGVRTVREVVDQSRAGDFDGWQAMAGVFNRGLITPVGAARRPVLNFTPARDGIFADWAVGSVIAGVAVATFLIYSTHRWSDHEQIWQKFQDSQSATVTQVESRALAWAERMPARWPAIEP